MYINLGLNEDTRKMVSEYLGHLLANEYFLYLETLNFHWNITGQSFIGLHTLLEQHYEWLKQAIDEIAERIRTIGYKAPGTYKDYVHQRSLGREQQDDAENKTANIMLMELVEAHEAMIRDLRQTLTRLEGLHDYATEDMLIQWLKVHEKNTWMLRSHLLYTPES